MCVIVRGITDIPATVVLLQWLALFMNIINVVFASHEIHMSKSQRQTTVAIAIGYLKRAPAQEVDHL